MLNDSTLMENKERIRGAMCAHHISSMDIIFFNEIPEHLQKDLKIYLADITIIFNPDKTGDQVSSAQFAVFLSEVFKGHDFKCETYDDFIKNFAAAFEREKKTSEQICSLFQETLNQIKGIPTTMGDEEGITPFR